MWGADRFVEGAAGTARSLGVSTLVIGLTIVGFGTSAPEMLVSALAAGRGSSGISVGNALGSNITNVALVLGAASVAAPLTVHSKIIGREIPILLGTMVLGYALLWDRDLSRIDGAILMTGLALMVFGTVGEGLRDRGGQADPIEAEFAEEIPEGMSLGRAMLWVFVGLAVLLGSAQLVVWGAQSVARYFGVDELIIGLTVVALGTSLPELAASVVSAVKGEHDIAIGNVIGSNMFNLLGVLALPGLIEPGEVSEDVLQRDYPTMVGITVLLYLKARGFQVKSQITRFNGVVLLLAYAAYVSWLFYEVAVGAPA